jgi:8-oxo-dGTP pyrophosphatase MutT (NUDIX family)
MIRYCPRCGAAVGRAMPPGDDRLRDICNACGEIHYQNPKLVVGAIPEWEGRILLCRRAIEPRYALWTLPAGYLENGETMEAGASRETLEECGAEIHDLALFGLFDLVFPHAHAPLPPRQRKPGGASFRPRRHPVGRAGFRRDPPHPGTLPGGPLPRLLRPAHRPGGTGSPPGAAPPDPTVPPFPCRSRPTGTPPAPGGPAPE